MPQQDARSSLEKEGLMVDIFIAIANVMDLDKDIRDGWITSLRNQKQASREYFENADDADFDDLLKGELDLISRFKAQIPNPKTTYEKCWMDNFTGDEVILKKMLGN